MNNEYDPNYISQKTYVIVGGKTVVFNTEGKILVMKRSQKCTRPGGWDFPGGGLNRGEDPYEGAKREIKEETGLEVANIKPVEVVSFFNEENDFIVMIGYKATVDINAVVTLSWEHDEYKWINPNEVDMYNLPARHMKLLKTALSS